MDDEGHNKPVLPIVPEKCGPPTISLNYLLDFAIQQIYHEITVLSELLPKKLDGDRKISLVQFAHSTRMLFVKLLAVVKWVKSSKKFESCAAICYLLDQHSQYFVETADRLVAISREELVLARLPAFQITAAVDVLTQVLYMLRFLSFISRTDYFVWRSGRRGPAVHMGSITKPSIHPESANCYQACLRG
uniref:Mediator of RNA polymerase II transcription subunit 14 n=1 Tax=Angiostrongylus cantonensis TaxID=6313 RepID=A0A0K0CYV1_ANGCA